MWYAMTTDTNNEIREIHGEYDTREDALDAAFDAATDMEVAFALESDPDFPTDEHHGLPSGINASDTPLVQVRSIQQWCRDRVSDVTVHRFGDRIVLRHERWADGVGWGRSVVTIQRDGSVDHSWHLGVVTAQSMQVVGGELL
jgi:hypothetical protein